jgi:hypothetical protein
LHQKKKYFEQANKLKNLGVKFMNVTDVVVKKKVFDLIKKEFANATETENQPVPIFFIDNKTQNNNHPYTQEQV